MKTFVLIINSEEPGQIIRALNRVTDEIYLNGITEGIHEVSPRGVRIGGWALA